MDKKLKGFAAFSSLRSSSHARSSHERGFAHVLILIAVVLVLAIGIAASSGALRPLYSPTINPSPSSNDYNKKIIGVVLNIKTQLSESSLTINQNGEVKYWARYLNRKMPDIIETGTFSDEQMKKLTEKIFENNFFSMPERPYNPKTDPIGGSYYYLTVKYFPGDPLEPMFPSQKTVYCYEFNCEKGFLEIKDVIVSFWGKEVLEVEVCKTDSDCPQPDCAVGPDEKPVGNCPYYICQQGQCVPKYY
ncbi:hypothetical protein A2W15_01370 [Candidatus Woesebacteria bacterium RBG_16_41_13]|nr:MAG: hypothetical protein A2W15_01370 [Candidatus Woesebacteria bacterium RBG_16_41_13]